LQSESRIPHPAEITRGVLAAFANFFAFFALEAFDREGREEMPRRTQKRAATEVVGVLRRSGSAPGAQIHGADDHAEQIGRN
jgi:hypothetical protein